MKKNTVRLTESQLHNVIKESVKNVLKENFRNSMDALNKANGGNDDEAYKTYRDMVHYFGFDDAMQACKIIDDVLYRIARECGGRVGSSVSPNTLKTYHDAVSKLRKGLDPMEGDLIDVVINQKVNPWTNKIDFRTWKSKPVPVVKQTKDEFDEPEDWHERNEHGDFDEY